MKRLIVSMTVAFAALALLCQSADAGGRRHRIDPRIKAVGLGVGAASTVTFLALNDWRWRDHGRASTGFTLGHAYLATTAGCMVAAPMIASAVVRRPLTYREAHSLLAGCVLPIIGPILVNAAWDAHPEWEAATRPRRARR